MKFFWAHEDEVVAYEKCKYQRDLFNFVAINTSNWSTMTIEVLFNGQHDPFTTRSDVIMHIYSCKQGRDQPTQIIVVERFAHIQ